ncbi:antibiotic biosynthesis monooxygenase [Bacillaceae bacterium JMAK1]|nr:antibiotic biosynthesis monooxygenase [Bacillaceae bacterium JMAK1]
MYVVMNELNVKEDQHDHVKARFEKSKDRMNDVPGCLEFLFLESEKEDVSFIVFTKWEAKSDYENWLNSDAFKHAHKGQQAESKEKPPTTASNLRSFDVVFHT